MAFLREKNADRPYHFGPYPFETLARNPDIEQREASSAAQPLPALDETDNDLAKIARIYANRFLGLRNNEVENRKAAVPDDNAMSSPCSFR